MTTPKNKIQIELLGNINNNGSQQIDPNLTIEEIVKHHSDGMKEDKPLALVQIGGPLGCFIKGNELRKPLKQFVNQMEMPSIMFLNQSFCPVDFAQFILFFVKRELQHQSNELNTLCQLIDDITSGKARKFTFTEFLDIIHSPSAKEDTMAQLKDKLRYLTHHYAADFKEHIDEKKCRHSICHKLFAAQCINTCPAEINIPGYVALMYRGKNEEAYRLMRQNNPLSFVCGKICARPCESRCRRGEIEQTVGVRALKHYAASVTLGHSFTEAKYENNGKSVGIIGSGPAGLSAAYYLAKSGYEVHIYEKLPVPGGMLAVGIPSYRLSQESINKEVQLIQDLGVNIHTNTEIGQHISFAELRKKHQSILLATGCPVPNIFSAEIENIESAIDFLREVKLDERQKVGKDVVVIGGGDVAMDAARTAIRLKAENVTVVSLESYQQMPANDEEKEEAKAEGVKLINGYGTHQILDKAQVAYGIELKRCTALYDLENKFAPRYNEKELKHIDCDQIILAIGQRSDVGYLDNELELDARGRIVSQHQYRTSSPGVFFAGDLTTPGSAIKAIAEGKQVAQKIDDYLGGKGLFKEEAIAIPDFQLHYSVWDIQPQKEEVELYSKNNKHPFAENRTILSDEMIRKETLRCMRCDRNSRG